MPRRRPFAPPRDWLEQNERKKFGTGRSLRWQQPTPEPPAGAGEQANRAERAAVALVAAAEVQNWASTAIRRAIRQQGTTSQAVADAVGVSVDTLRRALNGTSEMSLPMLWATCAALNLDPRDVLGPRS